MFVADASRLQLVVVVVVVALAGAPAAVRTKGALTARAVVPPRPMILRIIIDLPSGCGPTRGTPHHNREFASHPDETVLQHPHPSLRSGGRRAGSGGRRLREGCA